MNQIDPETFAHLVGLAALEMDDSEAEYLRRELNNQLKAIDELVAVPLDDNVEIAAHGVPYPPENSAPPRPDVPQPFSDPAAILKQAPESDSGYAVVPDIPHTTLD